MSWLSEMIRGLVLVNFDPEIRMRRSASVAIPQQHWYSIPSTYTEQRSPDPISYSSWQLPQQCLFEISSNSVSSFSHPMSISPSQATTRAICLAAYDRHGESVPLSPPRT